MENGIENRGNPTYKQMTQVFCLQIILHEFDEPFVSPTQVQHVFFLE
jgi:hypothetical protein